MAERVFEPVGTTVAQITLDPAVNLVPRRLDHLHTPFQRRFGRHAIADMGHAGGVGFGELERVKFVIVPGPQIGAVALLRGQFSP